MTKNKFINLFIVLNIIFFTNTLFANNFFTENQQNKFVYDFTKTITSYEATKLENDLLKLNQLTNNNVYLVILNNNQNLQTDPFIKSVMDEMRSSSNLYQKFIVLFLIKNKKEMLLTSDGKINLTVDQNTFSNNLRSLFHGEAKNKLDDGKYLDAIKISISKIKSYMQGYNEIALLDSTKADEQNFNEKNTPIVKENLKDDLNQKCFPVACEGTHKKKINVSDVSIKELRLRMSEAELLKVNPKFKLTPRNPSLKANENLYTCKDYKIDDRFFADPNFNICQMSVSTYHPYNVIAGFTDNKLSEFHIAFYVTSDNDMRRKFNDLIFTLTSKFGPPERSDSPDGEYYPLQQRLWVLGANQVTITLGVGRGTIVMQVLDKEGLDIQEFKANQEKEKSEQLNLKDLVKRRSRDI